MLLGLLQTISRITHIHNFLSTLETSLHTVIPLSKEINAVLDVLQIEITSFRNIRKAVLWEPTLKRILQIFKQWLSLKLNKP